MNHKISFNDFRAQVRRLQPQIDRGEIIELTSAVNRFRQILQTVAYAVHVGVQEQFPPLPVLLSQTLTHCPKRSLAMVRQAGMVIVRGPKTGDRFVLISAEFYEAFMNSEGSEVPSLQCVSDFRPHTVADIAIVQRPQVSGQSSQVGCRD